MTLLELQDTIKNLIKESDGKITLDSDITFFHSVTSSENATSENSIESYIRAHGTYVDKMKPGNPHGIFFVIRPNIVDMLRHAVQGMQEHTENEGGKQ